MCCALLVLRDAADDAAHHVDIVHSGASAVQLTILVVLIYEAPYRPEVVGVAQSLLVVVAFFFRVDGADYSADVAVEAVRVLVDDCDVAGVEDVHDVAGVPPADYAADDAVAVVDVAGVVGFLKRAGEASDYSADVASYVSVCRVAYRTGVVYVVYERALRRVCRRRHVSDDAAHVQRLS